jgi:hypothetical protein
VGVKQLVKKLPYTFGKETQVNFFIRFLEAEFKTTDFVDIVI